jgi:hypothetical protein
MTLDGKAIQPEKKRYGVWFSRKSFYTVDFEAESEKQAENLFVHYSQCCKQRASCSSVERIDDLGSVKHVPAVERNLSEAEFLATAKKLKDARAMRECLRRTEGTHREPIAERHETLTASPSPEGPSGQPEIKCYRLWVWYKNGDVFERGARNEKHAAELFFRWCQEDDDGIATYEIEAIDELEGDSDAMEKPQNDETATPPTESKTIGREDGAKTRGLTEADCVSRIERMKRSAKP